MTFAVGIVAIGPAIANLLSRAGTVSRDVFQILWDLCVVVGLFVFVVAYINYTKDKTKFMVKIVGISLVTLLLALQFISYYSLQDAEKSYNELRKSIAVKKNIPPFVIFQDPSIEEMTMQYPISIDELQNISGVGIGKAQRYGLPFLELIKKYVDENNIERVQDFVIKSVVNKSGQKVNIITNIDRKLPLEDIAKSQNKTIEDLIKEIENIVASGTKINIDYHLNNILDEEAQKEIYNYFLEDAETDDIKDAFDEFEGDYSEEELQLMKIKFMSEMAN